MTGAAVQTYLLEKTRVACQASSERNFHIFYQICKGATKDERLQWHLPEGTAFSWLPNPESSLEEDCFEVTREAMLHLGIDTPTQNNIFKVLAGLLHLGNVHFVDSEDEALPCQVMDDTKVSVRTSALLLQLPEKMLLESMQIRTIKAGKQQQVFQKPCSRAECDTRSAAQLQTRIESTLAGRPCLGHNKLSREPSFVVVHFAGPVRYHTAGLVEKNKDPVPPELTELLQQSQDPLLTMLFPANPEEKTQEELSGQSRAPALTVVSKFKASLEQLLQVLHNTTPHYIRCIKPNSQSQPQTFLQEEVLNQLQGLFLPAVLPKTLDPTRKCQAIPTATPTARASKFQPEPGLHGQSASLPGLWLQHWQDLGVLGTKPGLGPQHPSLVSLCSSSIQNVVTTARWILGHPQAL